MIQFLGDLGIVCKCEQEGWNDLSKQIFGALREPFRSLIPFQFHPDQQSPLRCAPNDSFASAPGDVNVHRREPPLPRQGTNRVIKATRKKATASVRQQLQNFARDRTPHHAPRTQHESRPEDPQRQLPRVSAQFSPSALNECGQRHLTTNPSAGRLPPPQMHAKNQVRQPLNNIELNTTQVHNVDERQRQVASISDISRFGRPGINNISSLLNHEIRASAIASPNTQNPPPGSPNSLIEPDGGTTGD